MKKSAGQAGAPGVRVEIGGGVRLHAVVRGAGAPAVIFEPALGGFSMQYAGMHARVAAVTRAVAYDRAGQGWSDASAEPRTPVHLAGELKRLLACLEVDPPYVLVGHSFGGLLARNYAGFYPGEVAGMVLVDATHVNEYELFADVEPFVRRAALGVRVMKLAARIGLGKALTRLSLGEAVKSFAPQDLEVFLAAASQPKHHETMLAEFSQHRCYFGAQSQVPVSLGDMPLVVVTAGESAWGKGKINGVSVEAVNELHQRLQKDLVRLSTRGEQVVLAGATHFTIFTRPAYAEQVAEAIVGMVERVRVG